MSRKGLKKKSVFDNLTAKEYKSLLKSEFQTPLCQHLKDHLEFNLTLHQDIIGNTI